MPEGLMNSYTTTEILDLLAYLESGVTPPSSSAKKLNNP
jgi:hypothetical protein